MGSGGHCPADRLRPGKTGAKPGTIDRREYGHERTCFYRWVPARFDHTWRQLETDIVQTRIRFTPDSLTAKNQTLQNLIELAYGVQDSQISGGPDWFATARFNIEAKLDSSVVAEMKKLSPEQQKTERDRMFQNLLADQFKVALHRESKLLPAYVLVVAKNGPKVQAAKPGDTYPNGIKGLDGLPAGPHKFEMSSNQLTVQAMPMSFVTEHLAMHLNQPIVDRTGLTGDYDFTFNWAPEGGSRDHKEVTAARKP